MNYYVIVENQVTAKMPTVHEGGSNVTEAKRRVAWSAERITHVLGNHASWHWSGTHQVTVYDGRKRPTYVVRVGYGETVKSPPPSWWPEQEKKR